MPPITTRRSTRISTVIWRRRCPPETSRSGCRSSFSPFRLSFFLFFAAAAERTTTSPGAVGRPVTLSCSGVAKAATCGSASGSTGSIGWGSGWGSGSTFDLSRDWGRQRKPPRARRAGPSCTDGGGRVMCRGTGSSGGSDGGVATANMPAATAVCSAAGFVRLPNRFFFAGGGAWPSGGLSQAVGSGDASPRRSQALVGGAVVPSPSNPDGRRGAPTTPGGGAGRPSTFGGGGGAAAWVGCGGGAAAGVGEGGGGALCVGGGDAVCVGGGGAATWVGGGDAVCVGGSGAAARVG